MKFPPNIKIPDSLKGVFKKSSTPAPLRETRRNPKDNIPLNFRERSNARVSLMASVIVLAILVLFFNQLDYRLIRKPAIDAQKKAASKPRPIRKQPTPLPKLPLPPSSQ